MSIYTELNADIKLKLISGEPLEVPSIGEIKPLTLRQIAKLGYEKYITHLNLFLVSKEDFVKEEYLEQMSIPLFNIMLAFSDEEFRKYIEDSLEMFLGFEVVAIKEEMMIVPKNPNMKLMITSENFDDLKQVIKWQNGIGTGTMKEDLKFKNDKAKQILEKLQKAQAEVEKQKRKEGSSNDLDFADIISAIASKSFSLNKLNVFELTVYQMYDEFRRLEIIDNYHMSVNAMLQGAKTELKHWTTKISD